MSAFGEFNKENMQCDFSFKTLCVNFDIWTKFFRLKIALHNYKMEVLKTSRARLLSKHICLQPFFSKDSVSLLFGYCLVHYLHKSFWILGLQMNRKCIFDHCRSSQKRELVNKMENLSRILNKWSDWVW